jgi:hypothetical protein
MRHSAVDGDRNPVVQAEVRRDVDSQRQPAAAVAPALERADGFE